MQKYGKYICIILQIRIVQEKEEGVDAQVSNKNKYCYNQRIIGNQFQAMEPHMEQKYQLIEKIGEGAYGLVYKAINKKTKTLCALKKIYDAFRNVTDAHRTYQQVKNIIALRHPNVVRLHDIHFSAKQSDLYLELEFLGQDLSKAIKKDKVDRTQIPSIFAQICSAIYYLHSGNLVHRDLKPSNILLDHKGGVKVCDFGHSRVINKHSRKLSFDCSTRWFKAPELLTNSKKYGKEVDVWGLGCILAEMYLGRPVFQGTSNYDQLQKIMEIIGVPHHTQLAEIIQNSPLAVLTSFNKFIRKQDLNKVIPNIDPDAQDLLSRIFRFDPKQRPTIQQIMNHSYLKKAESGIIMKQKLFSDEKSNSDEKMSIQKYKEMLKIIQEKINQTKTNIHILSPSPHLQIVTEKNKIHYKKFFGRFWNSPKRNNNSISKKNKKLNQTPTFAEVIPPMIPRKIFKSSEIFQKSYSPQKQLKKRPQTLRKLLSAKTVILRNSISKKKKKSQIRTISRADNPKNLEILAKKDRVSLKTVSSMTNIICCPQQQNIDDYLIIPAKQPRHNTEQQANKIKKLTKQKKSNEKVKMMRLKIDKNYYLKKDKGQNEKNASLFTTQVTTPTQSYAKVQETKRNLRDMTRNLGDIKYKESNHVPSFLTKNKHT